jgi:diguanylate cyclase (GGDEF)-like protein
MSPDPDPRLLPLIDDALSRPARFPALAPALRVLFDAEQDAGRRPFNRGMIAVVILVFDLFALTNRATVPDLMVLSCVLRLCLVTPYAAIFIALDWRGKLAGLYDPLLLGLSVSAAAVAALLSIMITTPSGLPDVQAAPLILLTTGMAWRMAPWAAAANVAACTALFILAEIFSPVVPRAQLGSMLLTTMAIAAACLMLSRRLEFRDRRVFLLNLNERIRRALVAEQNDGLLREVQTDALTNVANRRCFDETLSVLWQDARGRGAPLGLAMVDVDLFKKFNDFYGHQDGDDCLCRVAGQLRNAARSKDVVARYGGEEFALILPGATTETAAAVAERVRAAVAAMQLPHEGAGSGAIVTISVGVASAVPGDAQSARRLIEVADRHLYAAKQAGRNRVMANVAMAPLLASQRQAAD